ncbi:unnamed protein product [Alopecurus aequalis]
MGTEILSCTAEHSSQCSSGASTPSTESDATRELTTPGLPAAVTSRPALSSRFKGVVPQPNGRWGAQIYERHARVWLGTFPDEEGAARAYDVAARRYRGHEAATNYSWAADAAELAFLAAHSKAEIVDMLCKHTYSEELRQGLRRGRGLGARRRRRANGVLLNFEDAVGKVWRFRYSYWNSSKSYVLTRGWSRFVREKGLGAGDAIVFSCSAYGPGQQLFIDWKKTMLKDSRCAEGDGTLKVDEARVVRLFGVDIAGGKRGRAAEQGPQDCFKRQCVAHGQALSCHRCLRPITS